MVKKGDKIISNNIQKTQDLILNFFFWITLLGRASKERENIHGFLFELRKWILCESIMEPNKFP